jgi:hypothetical protein
MEEEMNTLKRMTVVLPALTLIMAFGAWNPATAQSFPEIIPLDSGFQPQEAHWCRDLLAP